MAKSHGKSIKDDETCDALRDQGASKEKAARIANAIASDSQSPSQKGGCKLPCEECTKDDLCTRAQELGIEWRPDMNMDALIRALRAHLSLRGCARDPLSQHQRCPGTRGALFARG
ncbi:Rho termination factor [Roseobacter sp.]|uniref:DUF7218 family protein n=1 Tax=Roseobacter sp. TaxID=1907202 RepID=UPI00344F47F1